VLPQRLRDTFAIEEKVVAAIPATELTVGTSQQRYATWRQTLDPSLHGPVEYLLPRIEIAIEPEWPAHFAPRVDDGQSSSDLRSRVDELQPWDVPFRLAHEQSTMGTDMAAAVTARRLLYRLQLVNDTVTRLLGDDLAQATVLDIGCHSGLFSLDLAAKGARHVDGVDLRALNVAQAQFIARHYGIENATFEVRDADDIDSSSTWDVVLNLGLLYHVLNPFQLIEQAYARCRAFAIIDTVCHTEPVSAFFVMGDKDVDNASEGKAEYEFHPTYRAVIDAIRHAGFSEVVEVTGRAERPHDLYASGNRRCFLAIK
jgi:2-polyprenyl-3-methyl-5-hydroxy-6-metoxy-1,4-benzoquinol methylase